MTTRRRRETKPRRDPNAPLRVVIVTRLSNRKVLPAADAAAPAKDRRDDEVSHETQEAGCRRKIAALGGTVAGVFGDTVSGDRLDRDGLWRAVDLVRSGGADAVMTYAVDRLGRDQIQQAVIVHEVRKAGGEVLSATEDLAAGPLGDFMRSTYAFAAEVELAKIKERTNRALDARFPQSKRYKPASRPPYGYRRVGTGAATTYVVDPAEAEVVRRIFREAAAGASRRKIADGLNRDAVPSPKGARWGITTLVTILSRCTYWTGEHEVWRTRTVRDGDGVPYREDRPAGERYSVPFPPLVDAALADRARAAAARNVRKSRRDDRPAEHGILRYGFALCASCGRALSLIAPARGQERYACTHHRHPHRPCPAPVSIGKDPLDANAWGWVRAMIEDPRRAPSYRIVREPDQADGALLAALADAERRVAELTGKATALAGNLALVTGPVARAVADALNGLNGELGEAQAERDRLAADAARASASPRMRIDPANAMGAAARAAVRAMREAVTPADPEPHDVIEVPSAWEDGAAGPYLHLVPNTWAAKQAALSVLDVRVTVYPRGADGPRWVAEMRLPGEMTVHGDGSGGQERPGPVYLNRQRA